MKNLVLDFWFKALSPRDWFSGKAKTDASIREKFSDLHEKAIACELFAWRTEPEGRLAEILLLDQFSRHIHRDSPRAFAADPLALALAQEAVAARADIQLSLPMRAFIYLPYMHSESLAIHEEAVKLFSQTGLENSLDFELRHKAIIERFGRYPHRNRILGRASSEAESEFLKQPGSGF
jgi:uncharacterized protein (DUF924 family)